MNDVPGSPRLEVLQVGALPDAGGVGQVVGLGDDGLVKEGGPLDAGGPSRGEDPLAPLLPRQARGRVHDLLPGHRVVHLLHVAAGDAVPVALGQIGLHGHDALGEALSGGGEGLGQPRQLEHRGHVRHIGLAQGGLRLLAVVGLVRQAQPRLADPARVALRVIDVDLDVCADDAHEPQRRHLSECPGQLLLGGGGQHRRQLNGQGLGPELLQALLIHEGRVESTDTAPVRAQDLGGRRGEVLGELLHDLAAGGLGLVAQHGEGTTARTICRDLGGGEPPAVDEAEQVVLGSDRGIACGRLQDTGENRGSGLSSGVQPRGGPRW